MTNIESIQKKYIYSQKMVFSNIKIFNNYLLNLKKQKNVFIEGCSNSSSRTQPIKLLSPVLYYNNAYINNLQILDLINNKSNNYNFVCYIFLYKNAKIINEKIKILCYHFECLMHYIYFYGFEFLLPENLEDSNGNINSFGKLNLLLNSIAKNNLAIIQRIIKEEFEVFIAKYLFRGLICYPFYDHYRANYYRCG